MSLKSLLGLNETGIADWEIINKLKEAQKKDLDEVEFVGKDGSITKISLPHVQFYPEMDQDSW